MPRAQLEILQEAGQAVLDHLAQHTGGQGVLATDITGLLEHLQYGLNKKGEPDAGYIVLSRRELLQMLQVLDHKREFSTMKMSDVIVVDTLISVDRASQLQNSQPKPRLP